MHDVFARSTTKENPKLLNHTILFLPSAVDSHTLPIALSRTVSAAKDMDHHFPVMVQINLLAVVHEYGIVICMYAGLPSSKGPSPRPLPPRRGLVHTICACTN